MTPDIDAAGMNHGYNYTSLGCLLAYPWEYEGESYDTTNDTGPYSVKSKIGEPLKRDLIFELQRDGSLKYWFKTDYIVSPFDTVTQLDGIKTLSKTISKSDKLKLKNIYNKGNWKVNFKDSSIRIDFGSNNFKLTPIEGKYYLLSATEMCIIKRATLDIIENGEKKKLEARLRRCFIH